MLCDLPGHSTSGTGEVGGPGNSIRIRLGKTSSKHHHLYIRSFAFFLFIYYKQEDSAEHLLLACFFFVFFFLRVSIFLIFLICLLLIFCVCVLTDHQGLQLVRILDDGIQRTMAATQDSELEYGRNYNYKVLCANTQTVSDSSGCCCVRVRLRAFLYRLLVLCMLLFVYLTYACLHSTPTFVHQCTLY